MADTPVINYASKYSDLIDEHFKLASVTDGAVNHDYDFTGVNTVFVYSSELAPLNDYDMSANSNRYGAPKELGNRVQELKLTQDKSFTFTIDARNSSDTELTQQASKCLEREIDEVITPTVDEYRLSVMAINAGITTTYDYSTNKPYEHYLDVSMQLTENKVPPSNRLVFMTPKFYKALKLDPTFVGNGDKASDIAQSGNIAGIDGATIKVVPTSYLPDGVNFLISHPMATTSPVKLAEYKQHDDVPGISGSLCEGRIYYDCFVLNNKKKAIAISMVATDEATEPTNEVSTQSDTVTDLSSMTVAQLKEYATANGISLNGATTKDAIIAVIEASESID